MGKIIMVAIVILIAASVFGWFGWKYLNQASSNKTAPYFPSEYKLQIKGDSECVKDTNDALDNLRVAAPSEYANVKKYIGIIECVESNSGIAVKEEPPRFQVGRATYASSYGSMTYAAVIAHEACHSRLYREYLTAHLGGEVPQDVYGGRNGEGKCLNVQVGVLKKLGASETILNNTRNQINTEWWKQTNHWW